MKTQKLIPLLDYVLEQKIPHKLDKIEAFDKVLNYTKFLSQPLKLSMFIVCDENQVPLEEPRMEYYDSMTGWNCPEDARNYQDKLEAYNKAKSNVLFEGFHLISDDDNFPQVELKNSDLWLSFFAQNVEVENEFGHEYNVYLVQDVVDLDLTLTENAVKLING